MRAKFIGTRKIVTRGHVISALRAIFDVKELQAIYKCGEGAEWYITLKDSNLVARLDSSEPTRIDDHLKVLLERFDRRNVKFRVHWFPLHMKKELVVEYFRRFGSDVHIEEESMDYGISLQTGRLRGTMNEDQYCSIPYRTRVYKRPVLITVLGRPSQCLRCGETGHQRARCPERQTAASYAAVLRRSQDDRNSSGEGREAEVPTTSSSEGIVEDADVLTGSESAQVLISSEGAQKSADVLTGSEGYRCTDLR